VPEPGGQSSGGSGQARFTLNVTLPGRYTLAGRVRTPTPDDDSFFLSVRAADGTEILPETAWSPGVFKAWTWRDVTASGKRLPAVLDLPPSGHAHPRPREPGSMLDQFAVPVVNSKSTTYGLTPPDTRLRRRE
jgi:hypothetical protein